MLAGRQNGSVRIDVNRQLGLELVNFLLLNFPDAWDSESMSCVCFRTLPRFRTWAALNPVAL